MNKMTLRDDNTINRYEHDEVCDAKRVKIVDADVNIKIDNVNVDNSQIRIEKVPEIIREIQIERIEVPFIQKEIQIEQIPYQQTVFTTKTEIQQIQVPTIVKETIIEKIEVPVVIVETKVEIIEKPVIIEKIKEVIPAWCWALIISLTIGLCITIFKGV